MKKDKRKKCSSHLRDFSHFQFSELAMLTPLGVVESGGSEAMDGEVEEAGDATDAESVVEDAVVVLELPLPFLRRRG